MVKKANFHQVLEREKIQRKAQQILDKIDLKKHHMTTTTDKNYQQVFILITMEDTYIKILKLLSPSPSLIPKVISSFSFNKYIE